MPSITQTAARGLKIISKPNTQTIGGVNITGIPMIPITFNVTYYNEPQWLRWWFDTTKDLYQKGCPVTLAIVDDGSMRVPASEYFEKRAPWPCMKLYRVIEDIGFNSHGARNLLMKQTTTDWNMLSDIDRQYPRETLQRIMSDEFNHTRGEYYTYLENRRKKDWSLNDYCCNRYDFWLTGGYDEEFTNMHTGDRVWFKNAFLDVVKEVRKPGMFVNYVRGARDVSESPDLYTTSYPDDDTLINPRTVWSDKKTREKLIAYIEERNRNREIRQTKRILTFPWEQVF